MAVFRSWVVSAVQQGITIRREGPNGLRKLNTPFAGFSFSDEIHAVFLVALLISGRFDFKFNATHARPVSGVDSHTIMRCLLIEDEKKVADFVSRGMRAERFAVDVAHEGDAGWDFASRFEYDIIILDLMLPGLSGTELLDRLRKQNARTPVLILTARDTTADKVRHFDAGADDYLTKPFAFAELLVRVKALLRRGPINQSSVLRVADLELDRLSQQVRRAGKRIDLTSKEYALLEYLLSNAGRVLSRTMIVEHVWDQSFHGLTNIVDVYVRHLRGKVDDAHGKKLIRTVRGAGYCLSDESEP
jgi:two-component system copper resistance phosphate regulon response regulator CusR